MKVQYLVTCAYGWGRGDTITQALQMCKTATGPSGLTSLVQIRRFEHPTELPNPRGVDCLMFEYQAGSTYEEISVNKMTLRQALKSF